MRGGGSGVLPSFPKSLAVYVRGGQISQTRPSTINQPVDISIVRGSGGRRTTASSSAIHIAKNLDGPGHRAPRLSPMVRQHIASLSHKFNPSGCRFGNWTAGYVGMIPGWLHRLIYISTAHDPNLAESLAERRGVVRNTFSCKRMQSK